MQTTRKPMVLLILDGWGFREDAESNAIKCAATPVWDRLIANCPYTLIATSGAAVGLPDEQMGNSEVGHMNLGAGRIVYQDYTRISKAIEDGSFSENSVLVEAIDAAVATNAAVHLMGLLSPGGVHSHESHLHALVDMATQRGATRLYLHAFLDGRDTPPKSAQPSLLAFEEKLMRSGIGRVATVSGRYYAMDRDRRWERVERAYRAITRGEVDHVAETATSALSSAYQRGETDEFVAPTCIVPANATVAVVEPGDTVLFANFRSDRARELSHAFLDARFDGFDRGQRPQVRFVCMTEYEETLDAAVAFPPVVIRNGMGEYLSELGLRQLRIAETEKYAHVTFFFNGGREKPYAGEDRQLVPSPRVATYDLQPAMSANELTDKLVAAIRGGGHDFIVCNYANPDMVGHTGIFAAAVEAIQVVDQCLGRIVEAVADAGAEMLITADHGNAELMRDPDTGQPHTAHTTGPVPLIYVGRPAELHSGGSLSDVSPTLLYLMGLEVPTAMSGDPLVTLRTEG
jgi:2,3-bisphosphoglycerate-independent phosphoglycerate mutase